MAKPCGTIVAMSEIFGGESVSRVSEVIEDYLQSADGTKCVIYDDACLFSATGPQLSFRHQVCLLKYAKSEKYNDSNSNN